MSASWISKLNETDGRLHKEDVLKQALEAAVLGNTASINFLSLLKKCYNPYVTYGVKQIPDTVGIINAENPWTEFSELLEVLAARELTGHAARDAIQDIAERFDSSEWNNFAATILRRDVRAGISSTTINKICKKTDYEIPVFGCQLATSCEGRPEMKGIKRLEPKLDGVRSLFVVEFKQSGPIVTCFSRNGKVFENFKHIEEQIATVAKKLVDSCLGTDQGRGLSHGFVLDGEVIGNSFQELMRQARRKTDVQADDSVLTVFDVIPLADFYNGFWNAQMHKRIALLDAMRPIIDSTLNVELLPHIMVNLDTAEGMNQLERYAQDNVAAGFEGIMIKDVNSPYECTRSTFWMKWKPTITLDLQVVGVEEGTGRNAGRMGALVFAGVDAGREISVNVGSGYDDKFRAQVWADVTNKPVTWKKKEKGEWVSVTEQPSGKSCIGDTGEVMCDVITQNRDGTYSLRFPRFVRFRDDK